MKTNRQQNRGYIMLDLLIVMSLTVLILSTTSVWLYKTIRYTTEVAQRDSHAPNISRISLQLRSDARDASSVSTDADTLTITKEETSIEYQIDANSIHRKVTGGDKIHHDDFTFVDNAKLVWTETDNSKSAALEIARDFSQMSASKKTQPKGLDARIVIRAAAEAAQ